MGAAYLLWLYQRTMFGEISEKNAKLLDLSPREIAVFTPLLIAAFWIGIYPKPIFTVMERPVAQIVERVRPGYHVQHGLKNPLAAPASVAQLH
jgi:NADH-quinone oxidoreductase subunit M